MAISNNEVVVKEMYPFVRIDVSKELREENQVDPTVVVVVHKAATKQVVDYIEFSYDTNFQSGATLEFVKLAATQGADAYILAPSSTTGGILTLDSSNVRTTIAVDTGALTQQSVDLTRVAESVRTLAVGDRIVCIQRGMRTSGGSGSGSGEPGVKGGENAACALLLRCWPIGL